MGMYTEFKCQGCLAPDTPAEVIDLLRIMATGNPMDVLPDSDHPLFKTRSWTQIINGSDNEEQLELRDRGLDLYEVPTGWLFNFSGFLKNYENEIELFIEWISPYLLEGFNPTFKSLYEDDSEWRELWK